MSKLTLDFYAKHILHLLEKGQKFEFRKDFNIDNKPYTTKSVDPARQEVTELCNCEKEYQNIWKQYGSRGPINKQPHVKL